MKSSERCKAQHQGDRCQKAVGHDQSLTAEDRIHEGQFTVWQPGKFASEKFPVTQKRNRQLNRFADRLNPTEVRNTAPEARRRVYPHLSLALLNHVLGKLRPADQGV